MITKFTTPFSQYLCKDKDGFYNVRLGPKIYLAKLSLNYTPDFDKEFFGGAQDQKFDWYSIRVRDSQDGELRQITTDDLSKTWFKGALKKVINYQRAIERTARNSQGSRYSANQRTSYNNAQSN
ncbi:hypothetical protein [Acinetobacter proteolyticus]|uniref:Uncharacterized protein n=1 Tax=Acinetobacter proteolyticus TaxID=1776741 RepID=A0A2N0WBT0_9GAMM|nr:hypothetical protein [Acinetobacter proteolyticus]PKF31954.1 hypothetical protein CW311_17110 [Acinetobacter proteolyticus]